jgi:hypothetical protein
MTRTMRALRRTLAAYRDTDSAAAVWARQPGELFRALTVVRAFYVCAAFIVVHEIQSWQQWTDVKTLYWAWPLAWAESMGVSDAIPLVLGTVLGSVLCAALMPQWRSARVLALLGLLWQSALINSLSDAVIMHSLHAWIWVAGWFVFLPRGSWAVIARSRARAQRSLRVFWAAQLTMLLFYSLSGSLKVVGSILQFARGEVHAFAPDALARHVALRVLEGIDPPAYFALGPTVLEHPAIGVLIFPLTIYLETCSLLVAFRPALHRLWGGCLILMHLGIYFVMGILFSWQILLVGLMLVASPFAPQELRPREVLLQLPLVGDLARLMRGVMQPSLQRCTLATDCDVPAARRATMPNSRV